VPVLEAPPDHAWIDGLRVRDARTLAELHALLLRAARFELRRRGAGRDLDDLAHQSAHDALLAILAKLDTFRGDSRFTTWAYKFALLEAAVAMRRRTWQCREIPLEPDVWPQLVDRAGGPAQAAEQRELLRAIRCGIETALTDHQREVLVAVALNDVPIDVLAERLHTTRGALYKTVHDARRRLRTYLESR
jgi:RNA polymerase sigma-70 factor, ECF subfamily